MGLIMKANCKCGFEDTIFAGGGMMNFEVYNASPALCLKCSEFLVINRKDSDHTCPDCGYEAQFYGSPHIYTDATYLCPKCKNKSLKFDDIGHWD